MQSSPFCKSEPQTAQDRGASTSMLDARTAWRCGRTQQEGRRGGQHRARRQALGVVGAPDGREQQQRRRVAARQQRRAPANMVSWITRM